LLRNLLALEFQGEAGSPVLGALGQLQRWYAEQQLELPEELDLSFTPEWASILHGSDRRRYYRHLGVPPTLRRYSAPLLATLAGALEEVAEAVRAGMIVIENGQLHLPALVAEAAPVGLRQTQERLFQQIGTVQLPELILEMDSQTRFSWTLLGREPRSIPELLALYGGLLAQGTELTWRRWR
jgi:hypothetical protein